MTRQTLLCAITAHDGRHFILSEDEVLRAVALGKAEALLDHPHLFWEAFGRLTRDGLPLERIVRRLVAVYGPSRVADYFSAAFGSGRI